MISSFWRPATGLDMLRARAALMKRVRDFFQARDVLEVETPLLARSIGSDPNLQPIEARYEPAPGAVTERAFLQTSPEFAMKRLLAAGSGPIFQLCKAFRNGESGSRHNPEFTMLEWYRPGFTHLDLMDEVEALVALVLPQSKFRRLTYRELFQESLGFDPHTLNLKDLRLQAEKHIEQGLFLDDKDTCLDLLFSHCIEPGLQDAVFIYDYPASQAALARVEEDERGVPVARRFELVVGGLEIANGYYELSDAEEQAARFDRDQVLRRQRGMPLYPRDEALLAALRHGLPDCAGVALGLDRLLMLVTAAGSIGEVMAFPWNTASR